MKIFFIANSNKSDNWIKFINSKFNIKKEDFIVRFNKCKHTKLFNGYTTHYFMRSDGGKSVLGVNNNFYLNRNIIKNNKDNIKFGIIYFRNVSNILIPQIKNIEKNNSIKLNNNIIIDTPEIKITGKSPSSGFITILYFLKKYPNSTFYLLGFNFGLLSNIPTCHNNKREFELIKLLIMKNNNIKTY